MQLSMCPQYLIYCIGMQVSQSHLYTNIEEVSMYLHPALNSRGKGGIQLSLCYQSLLYSSVEEGLTCILLSTVEGRVGRDRVPIVNQSFTVEGRLGCRQFHNLSSRVSLQ